MYIVKNVKRVKNKVYISTLLVKGYRENGKVKHKVISNLSSWPEELIKEFKLLLKGNKVNDVSDLNRLKDLNSTLSVQKQETYFKSIFPDNSSENVATTFSSCSRKYSF